MFLNGRLHWPDLIEIKQAGLRELLDLQFRSQMRCLRSQLAESPAKGLSVLDFGAGRSPYAELFADAQSFVAVDPHDPAAPHREIPVGMRFDRILLIEVLEHVAEPEMVLRDLSARLSATGEIWISVPFAARVHGVPGDFWRWTSEGLAKLARYAGMKIDTLRVRGNALSVLASKTAFLAVQCLRQPKTFLLGVALAVLGVSWMIPLAWFLGESELPVEDPLGYFVVLSPSQRGEVSQG